MTAKAQQAGRAPYGPAARVVALGLLMAAVPATAWLAGWPVKPPFVLSGLAVGLLVGMTGVGGGSLMTPILILLFGVHPAAAVGTDLLYASATKTAGAGVHASNRTVDWALVARLASGSVPATLLTLLAMREFHLVSDRAAHPLSVGLGVVLFMTAAVLVLRPRLERLARRRPLRLSASTTTALTVALGALLGVLITLTSVGAGALGVTVLVFLHPRTPLARIVGSDIAHAVPLTLIAGLGRWAMGSVDVDLLSSLLCGSVPGVVAGSLLARHLPEAALRLLLAATLALAASKLVA